jgi:hypothetical protein
MLYGSYMPLWLSIPLAIAAVIFIGIVALAVYDFIHYAVSQGFGTKMPRVSHKLVSEYKIYAPDLKEQEKILSDLKRLSTIDAQLSTSIQQARALRSAILDQTFQS